MGDALVAINAGGASGEALGVLLDRTSALGRIVHGIKIMAVAAFA